MNLEYINKEEAEQLQQEIVVGNCYFRHGITLSDGDVLIDCGANIGIFSLLCLSKAADLTLICIEPVPIIFSTLQSNLSNALQLYPSSSITALELATADISGPSMFQYIPECPGESCLQDYLSERTTQQNLLSEAIERSDNEELKTSFFLHRHSNNCEGNESNRRLSHTFEVEVRRLEDILQHLKLESRPIHLLKIDVEGAELVTLIGLGNHWRNVLQIVVGKKGIDLLGRYSTGSTLFLTVEVHDIDGRLANIVTLLSSKGFTHIATERQTTQVSYHSYHSS